MEFLFWSKLWFSQSFFFKAQVPRPQQLILYCIDWIPSNRLKLVQVKFIDYLNQETPQGTKSVQFEVL